MFLKVIEIIIVSDKEEVNKKPAGRIFSIPTICDATFLPVIHPEFKFHQSYLFFLLSKSVK